MTIHRLVTACLATVLIGTATAQTRTWTSADGKYAIDGELVGFDAASGIVQIDTGSKKVAVKLSVLSQYDVAYLREIGAPVPSAGAPAAGLSAKPVATALAKGSWAKPPVAEQFPDAEFFTPFPKPKGSSGKQAWLIQNFGPVGIGINLTGPGLNLEIHNVEPGSPADQTGKLKQGQIIEGINGREFGKLDPRLQLAEIITDAEATDGKVVINIKGAGQVTVTIPVMGRYSNSWPLNCPKSDKIVRNLADLIAEKGENEWGSVLFLLSTGEEKDLAVVRNWMKNRKDVGSINWAIGYRGIGVCEYYLRTGDASVLPIIQKAADHLRDHIYNGGWAGRGGSFGYQSGGHLNAAGVHCVTFLLLAKSCGVNVDEPTLQSSLRHFYRYSGRGSVPYGDYTSKAGFSDCNGKTGGLALAMAAASKATPEGDQSIYAQAAQVNAMKSFYGVNVYCMGHTGGGIGEIWKSAAMGLMADQRPDQYRAYLNARWWTLELSRRFNGAIGIAGGKESNYDVATGEGGKGIAWGTYHALNYTLARKQLQIFGAPRSKWAKSYTLPERPWGTAADDAFSSPFPVPGGPWADQDIFKETPEQHAGKAAYALLSGAKVSDETLLTYLHHPEITHRFEAKSAMLRLKKDDMLMELLMSPDARLQHIGVMALHDLFGTWEKKAADPGRVSPAMMKQVDKLIRDPDGSWYVKQWALGLLQHTDIDNLRTYKDLLVQLVEHEEQWVQGSAISASTPLLMDKASYRELFPPIARAISNATAYPIITRARFITEKLGDADPEIQAYGLELMKKVYVTQPNELISERGIYVIPDGGAIKRQAIGQVVGFSEAGMEFLNSQPKITSAWKASGKETDLYTFGGKFEAKPVMEGTWIMIDHKELETKAEALSFIKERLNQDKVPTVRDSKTKYGFTIDGEGRMKPIQFTKMAYDFPLRYSGDMAFSTFIDKAYRCETLSHDGRDYLLVENNFEPQQESGFKGIFKSYVKVSE